MNQPNAITIVERNLGSIYKNLQSVIPAMSDITPARVARCIINAMEINPKLQGCTPQSVIQSAMTSAVLGLEVDNVTGQAYLVPFSDKGTLKAQLIPGYKGYKSLAARSGYILDGFIVREGDEFDYEEGSRPFVHHKPLKAPEKERGEIIFAYAVARSNTLPELIRVMHISEVLNIRDNSAGWKAHLKYGINTVWKSNPAAMMKKTPIRQLGANLPMNFHIASVIEAAHDRGVFAYATGPAEVHFSDQVPPQKKTDEQPDLVDDKGNLKHDVTEAEFIDVPAPSAASPQESPACARCGGKGSVPFNDAGEEGIEPCPDCSQVKK